MLWLTVSLVISFITFFFNIFCPHAVWCSYFKQDWVMLISVVDTPPSRSLYKPAVQSLIIGQSLPAPSPGPSYLLALLCPLWLGWHLVWAATSFPSCISLHCTVSLLTLLPPGGRTWSWHVETKLVLPGENYKQASLSRSSLYNHFEWP